MRQLILILGLQLFIFSVEAQNTKTSPISSWLGTWKGQLKVDNAKDGKTLSFPMTLNIQPTDSSTRYSWTVIYGEEAACKSALMSYWTRAMAIYYRRKNSILLDAYMLGIHW
ncbi:hypothetical protein [Microscilla marina]|uniref:Lipocalin-like domain-containing protein n=1 Tax=Microscilla marina ATCC 23134 TaxID=313606 RepID=A1ZSK1_MICM2|nr:hypothetical protein [Microscilla marina]EAY26581.1 hypothetical protein M23134_06108 [Microscilla marina ATCC 23134]